MRRTTARGRVFPQFYSTDRRYARLSVKAIALYPLIWANGDDQGRICGDPEEIKYTCCPNVDHITKAEVPLLLEELAAQKLILRYDSTKGPTIQMLDWWEVHRLQWAWPSDYAPPDGWQDHLRYKKSATEVTTLNWPVSPETSGASQVSNNSASGEQESKGFLPTPKRIRKGNRIGIGNSPETSDTAQVSNNSASGEKPSPSPADFCTDRNKISSELLDNFRMQWGRVEAKDLDKIIPREPGGKDLAQLRDMAAEIVAGGGCPLSYIREAFREAGGQGKNKEKISYVRAILFDWLGIERNRSP